MARARRLTLMLFSLKVSECVNDVASWMSAVEPWEDRAALVLD